MQTGGVYQDQLCVGAIDNPANRMPRGLGAMRHDRYLLPYHRVGQRGFAHVRPPHQAGETRTMLNSSAHICYLTGKPGPAHVAWWELGIGGPHRQPYGLPPPPGVGRLYALAPVRGGGSYWLNAGAGY